MTGTRAHSNFDHIARPYRWLEYLTLGRTLERCRLRFLPQLADRTHALILGDGDGRFLAEIFAHNPAVRADAIDTSAAMLDLLRKRCHPGARDRLQTHHSDAHSFLASAPSGSYDLVVTHFFLDCFTQSQVETLATVAASRLTPDALWLVSDFRIPSGPMRLPAAILVRGLYLAFRVLTGLRTDRLPDHESALGRAGLSRIAQHTSLLGILSTELWTVSQDAAEDRLPGLTQT